MKPLRWFETALVVVGFGCLAVVGVRHVQASTAQQVASEALDRDLMAAGVIAAPAQPPSDGIIGRLEIPRLDFSVMVLEGDDTATLARAVGHVPGTAFPWDVGNTVMAGHRDTFFRPLEKLRDGDQIHLTTARGAFDYRVTSTEIVAPDDVSVLAPTTESSLTLVTCYPFDYVGFAPRRFIIHAR